MDSVFKGHQIYIAQCIVYLRWNRTLRLRDENASSLLSVVGNMLGRLAKLDAIHPLGKSKGAETFVAAFHGGAQIDKHERLSITTQAVLEEIGQLGVSVRYVRRTIAQSVEYITKTAQTLIDGLSFLQTLGICSGATAIEALGTLFVRKTSMNKK